MSGVHDRAAAGYRADAGPIAEKNAIVVDQAVARGDSDDGLRIVDLGVGDGTLLAMLAEQIGRTELVGLDVSSAMLAKARSRAPMTVIQASAADATDHLALRAWDLVIAHFIFAYVDRHHLLRQAERLLAPGGVISVVTSTNESATRWIEEVETRFRRSWNPARRAIAWGVDRAFAKSDIPDDFAELRRDAHAAGLRVLSRHSLRTHTVFASLSDAYRVAIDEGWCLHLLSALPLPTALGAALVRGGFSLFDYPMEFTHVTEVVELGRLSEHASTTPARGADAP